MEPRIDRLLLLVIVDLVLGSPTGNIDTTVPQMIDMTEDFPEITTPSRFSNLIEFLSNQNSVPSNIDFSITPYQIIDRSSRFLVQNGYEPFSLEDLLIPGSSVSLFRDAQSSQVLLQGGRLFGMSDIYFIDNPSADPSQMWLMWKHLHVSYRVTVDTDGLKDVGDLDVKVGRLLIHVQAPSSNSVGPNVKTSKIGTLKSKLTGLDMASEEVKTAICSEAESRIIGLLNGKVRHILLNQIKKTVDEDSSDNELLPLKTRFYEVTFDELSLQNTVDFR